MKRTSLWLAVLLFGVVNGLVSQQTYAQLPEGVLWAKWGVIDLTTSLCLLPKQESVVTTGYDGICGLWPLDGSRPRWSAQQFVGTIYCSAPIGQTGMVLCGLSPGTICIYDPTTGMYGPAITVSSTGATVRYIACNPNGTIAAESGDDGHFRIIDIASETTKLDLSGSAQGAGPVCFSSDGALVLGVTNNVLQIIDVSTLKVIKTFPNLLPGYSTAAANPAMIGQFAISGSNGLKVIDSSGNVLASWPYFDEASSIDYSPNGKLLAVSENGLDLEILNLSDDSSFSIGSSIYARFINNDTIVSTVGDDISLFSFNQKGPIGSFTTEAGGGRMVFSSDGTQLASSGSTIEIHNAETGNLVSQANAMGLDELIGFSATSDLQKFAASGQGGEIYFWPSISALPITLRNSISDTSPTVTVEFSPTDSIFADGTALFEPDTLYQDSRNVVELRSAADGSLIRKLEGPLLPVTNVEFSSDGSKVGATFQGTGIICVWDTHDGTLLDSTSDGDPSISFVYNQLPGTNDVMVIDPLYEGDNDTTIKVRDLSSGDFTQTFTLAGEVFKSLSVNPINGDFATGTENGDLLMWKSPLNSAIKQAPPQIQQQLEAFEGNGCITVRIPSMSVEQAGKVFVYRSDGRCYFTSEVSPGVNSITTSALPLGDYFIVYEPSIGDKAFTKVSLF